MLKPNDDLETVVFNDLNIRIGKDRYAKLSTKHLQVIEEFDRDNIIKGNNETTRENQIKTLIKFAIKFGKEFDNVTKQDINESLKLYKGNTLNIYKMNLKKFFKWLKKPELVEHLKSQTVAEKLTSEDLWTEEEMLKLLTACDTTTLEGKRDQALVAIMYDLSLERFAVVNLNIEDIKENNGTMKIRVSGKRRGNVQQVILQPIMSVYYLRQWLSVHPNRTDGTKPLFICLSTRNYGQRMGDSRPWFILKKLQKRSGVEKKLRPHLLRHSKATELYKKGFRGIPLQRYLRHSSIKMQERYAHLCDEDVNCERVAIETGIDPRENKPDKKVLMNITCPKCNEMNPPTNTYCNDCSYPLNPQVDTLEQMIVRFLKSALYQSEKQISQETNEFMDVEMLARKFDQLLKDQQVKGRKQVKVIPH